MKKLIQLLVIIFLAIGMALPVFAETKEKMSKDHKGHAHEVSAKKVAKGKVLVKVNGMVCAFCAQGITKNFKKRKEVKDVKVDLDKMEVLIHFKPNQEMKISEIEKIVTSAGFKYVGIKK